jgi:zinc transporter
MAMAGRFGPARSGAMLDRGTTHGLAVEIPGLVFAYRFREGAAERLDASEAARSLHEPGTWLWLHFSLAEPGARDFIAGAAIPERARALLLSDDDHLRLEPIEGGVAGVFADFLRDLDGESRGIGRLRFALTDTLVVSGRRSALGGISRTLLAIDEGARFPHAVALLEAIVDHFADAVASVAQELADTLDSIEDRVLEERTSDERASLGPVRRTAVRLHRQLASLRVLFRRWGGPAGGELPSRLGEAAARLAQRLDSLDLEIVSLQDRAKLLQDEIAAKLATETNRHLFALTLATAFVLPPTLVVGIFGMNVSDLPFTKGENGFYWAMLLTTAACATVYGLLRMLKIMR